MYLVTCHMLVNSETVGDVDCGDRTPSASTCRSVAAAGFDSLCLFMTYKKKYVEQIS